jgi:hypothetical protein
LNTRSLRAAAALCAAGTLTMAASAAAETRTVSAAKAVDRTCHDRYVGERAGTDVLRTTSKADGLVQARLSGRGDWDVGVFDARSKRYVAGSSAFGANELAEGFVRKGQKLLVQACRYRGDGASARVSVRFDALPTTTAAARATSAADKVQVVSVKVADTAAKNRLQGLGLDLTEHGQDGELEVVTYGEGDRRKLRDAGFKFDVEIADLEARSNANRSKDRSFAAAVAQSDLPSGRDAYRHLADYEAELKTLAQQYPGLTRPITLNHKSLLGRDVTGIEITRNADYVNDGKPIFLNMGVHHAREWPSSEHAMEFAYDLLTNYGKAERTTQLVNQTRTIVVPIVNPDGFNISREGSRPPGSQQFSIFDYEMKRKNCRVSETTWEGYETGTCENNPGGAYRGTDNNRNYGTYWGGPGASTFWADADFRGDAPFSEPETQNIRELHSERNVTNLITNHTYSNLLLRPPGLASAQPPVEEPLYAALGADMAEHNDYANIQSFGLYDTTGTTEDWTYWTAGSLGFTFEIGPDEFHPPYEDGVVAEYLGREPAEGAGQGGNREAYYSMLAATADETYHSVLEGNAPAGWKVKVGKSFTSETSPVIGGGGEILQFPDELEYTLDSQGGKFDFHVTPSTRPYVGGRIGRIPEAPTQAPLSLANPPGIPALNTGSPYNGPHEEVDFAVQGLPQADNGEMTVTFGWSDSNVDWDLYLVNQDTGQVAAQAATLSNPEVATIPNPPAGDYRAYLVNYSQAGRTQENWDDWTRLDVAFAPPKPPIEGTKEAWTVTCERRDGQVRSTRQVIVDRGDSADLGNACKK